MDSHAVEVGAAAPPEDEKKTHKTLRIVLIMFCVILFLFTAIVNSMASGSGQQIGLYLNSTGGVSDYYYVEITPAGWAFSIWGIIYFFQAALIIYFIVNLFRKTAHRTGVFYDPNFISLPFLIFYNINFVINSSWIFIFDRSIANRVLLSVACFFLWLIFACLVVALVFSYLDLDREATTLLKYGQVADIWVVRVLLQNGVSLYATWCAVASPLNTSIALAHVQFMSQVDACTVGLSLLAVEIVAYVSLDTFLLDRWTRYTLSPHCVLVWALSASLSKNYVAGKRNSIFTAVLLGMAVFAVVEKVVLMAVRHVKQPLYSAAISDSSLKSESTKTGEKTVL